MDRGLRHYPSSSCRLPTADFLPADLEVGEEQHPVSRFDYVDLEAGEPAQGSAVPAAAASPSNDTFSVLWSTSTCKMPVGWATAISFDVPSGSLTA